LPWWTSITGREIVVELIGERLKEAEHEFVLG
jgi:hypothetical protein